MLTQLQRASRALHLARLAMEHQEPGRGVEQFRDSPPSVLLACPSWCAGGIGGTRGVGPHVEQCWARQDPWPRIDQGVSRARAALDVAGLWASWKQIR